MTDLKDLLREVLSKDLLLDLEDRSRAEAVKAFEMVRDRSGLDKKRARELEGQARFRMMEQGFEDVCKLHGGRPLDGGVIPHTELKVFQPFQRFDVEGQGIILGLAAMPEPKTLPPKNKSRLAGVSLNYDLLPRLDFDGRGPKIGDIFALLLISRHRETAGRIEEVAVGVVDSKYESFLFYEPLDKFLQGFGEAAADRPMPSTPPEAPPAAAVVLRKVVKTFVPPEAPKREEEGGTGTT
jgi:hypothetical protein